MLNPPNLSGTTGSAESLCPRPEAPRHKGQGNLHASQLPLWHCPVLLPCVYPVQGLWTHSLMGSSLHLSGVGPGESCSLSWATCIRVTRLCPQSPSDDCVRLGEPVWLETRVPK